MRNMRNLNICIYQKPQRARTRRKRRKRIPLRSKPGGRHAQHENSSPEADRLSGPPQTNLDAQWQIPVESSPESQAGEREYVRRRGPLEFARGRMGRRIFQDDLSSRGVLRCKSNILVIETVEIVTNRADNGWIKRKIMRHLWICTAW